MKDIYTIDVSSLASLYNKTMLYYLIGAFDDFKIEKNDVVEFIRNDIGNYEYILEQLEYELDNLKYVTLLTDNGVKYSTFNSKDYYNSAVNVMMMDAVHKLFNKIIFEIDRDTIMENIRILDQIRGIIIHLNVGVSDYGIRKAQESGDFNFQSKYMPSPLLIGDLEDLKQVWELFLGDYVNIESDEARKILSLKLRTDIEFIKGKINFIEFMLSIICILNSPFYKEDCKEPLFKMYKEIQELMHNCNIGAFFIEYGNVSNIPHQERTATDRTTRIQILFILDNKKPYSLRIDLPHKGEGYVHLNIEDIYGDNAVPISIKTFRCLQSHVSNGSELEKLFYKKDDKFWFRQNFMKHMLDLKLLDEDKNKLEQVFKQQSHFNIANIECKNEIELVACFEELKTYINRNVYNRRYALNNQKLNRYSLLKRLQLQVNLSVICLLCSLPTWQKDEEERKNELEDLKEKFVDSLYGYYEFGEYPQNELKSLDLLTILELIDDELYRYWV